MKKETSLIIFSILAILLFAFSLISYAWQEPTTNPPDGNVYTPINTGPSSQGKGGGVDSNYILTLSNKGLKITNTSNQPTLYLEDQASDPTPFVVTADGKVGIKTTTPGNYSLFVNGDIAVSAGHGYFYASDIKEKKDIHVLKNSLDKILKLRGVSFVWKTTNIPSIGLIAQEVEEVYPEAVIVNASTGLKSVDYGKLIAPLIEAVKEQQKQIEKLKKEVQELKMLLNDQGK